MPWARLVSAIAPNAYICALSRTCPTETRRQARGRLEARLLYIAVRNLFFIFRIYLIARRLGPSASFIPRASARALGSRPGGGKSGRAKEESLYEMDARFAQRFELFGSL